MKIAIVHEMLIKFGGAEQVVKQIQDIFPESDLFTLLYDEQKIGKHFPKTEIHSSCFSLPSQKIYNLLKKQRLCLPWMPRSAEMLDLSDYDIVLVSSSGMAHGIITKPETKCVIYYHSPARYLWDWTNETKASLGATTGLKGFIFNRIFLNLRQWDYMAAQRSDRIIANSHNVAKRIQKYYRKNAEVIYPGVDTKKFFCKDPKKGKYYIILSALTEFKNIDIAIEAFHIISDKKLVIIGDGAYRETLESKVRSNNISFVGAKYGDDLVKLVQESAGLIFPGEEDFGIVPIEVMAAGKPVFAYKGGGLLESVAEGKTGDFFDDKNGSDFVEKFRVFDKKNSAGEYSPEECIKQAQKFDKSVFEEKLREITL
ncbi:glycosyltransferase [Candidatus Gracilibacteria bacterium]|nr:glycosyltransferase [Candidatus Gracilibacteria bacterium]